MLPGEKIHHWTIVQFLQGRAVECRCICGQVSTIDKHKLKGGKTKSCGCQSKTEAELTNLARYQVKNAAQNSQLLAKRAQTNLERYGTEHPIRIEKFKELRRITNMQKYGYAEVLSSPSIRDRIHAARGDVRIRLADNRLAYDIIRQYNVHHVNAYKVLRDYGEQAFLDYCSTHQTPLSSLEQATLQLFEDLLIERFNKFPHPDLRYRPDFKINNLFINVDGLFIHSQQDLRPLATDYHFKMREAFTSKGLRIVQFREDEIRDKGEIVRSIVLANLGQIATKIDARKCSLSLIRGSEAAAFFKENHLMGHHKQSTCFGLQYQDKIVAAMSVRRQGQDIEIARFCTKKETIVRGAFAKLLSYIEQLYNPVRVISFCDMRYATGHSYIKNGFVLDSLKLSWQWTDSYKTYNRLFCRANMDDRKLSQAQHAQELGLRQIYDAGQGKFIKYIRK
jgi:hypothetical protein